MEVEMSKNTNEKFWKVLLIPWIISVVCGVVAPLLLLFAPIIMETDPKQLVVFSLVFASVLNAMVILAINQAIAIVSESQKDIGRVKELMENEVYNNRISAVRKSEMYDTMSSFTAIVKEKINTMYLGKKPPNQYVPSKEKDSYYKVLHDIIEDGRVIVSRIILLSQENKPWIRECCDNYKDKDHFSLYIIDSAFFDAPSVQIYDDSKVVIMNLNSSDTMAVSVGVVIESKTGTSTFEQYYERLKSEAIALCENGNFNEDNYKKYVE
jgi:hypothetical protein